MRNNWYHNPDEKKKTKAVWTILAWNYYLQFRIFYQKAKGNYCNFHLHNFAFNWNLINKWAWIPRLFSRLFIKIIGHTHLFKIFNSLFSGFSFKIFQPRCFNDAPFASIYFKIYLNKIRIGNARLSLKYVFISFILVNFT